MDCARLNFSHGTQDEHRALFNRVKQLSVLNSNQVAIMCDIQGPKIRTGRMVAPFTIAPDDLIDVCPNEVLGTPQLIQIKYATMLNDLDKGDTIFINDGIVKLRVLSKSAISLHCICEAGGIISDHKGCNIPSGNISLDVITAKDERDLKLIAELNPEYVACSFVGTADDVRKVRNMLAKYGNSEIKIISKIERPVALQNIDAIIEETDGVMVARGDLGVEIDTWDVPTAQKMLCKKCNKAGKPVIVATQMLESMTAAPRPTRAEANDVYNAVLDGTDAVMLSGETAMGKYPVESIKIMDNIVAEAEKHLPPRTPTEFLSNHVGMTETVALSVYHMAQNFRDHNFNAKILAIAYPPSAYTARMLSKFRPPAHVITLSNNLRVAREINLLWGVRSVFVEGMVEEDDLERRNLFCIQKAREIELLGNDVSFCVV
eukprot:TRINITY_DN4789_c0_g1_i2.p1 TRINITY_DN4789_c0_g1~~TRINITY_DN4789_c0_g1_i2.p1  ORF type:complete len:480 (-),score=114.62 TRINITY_DN4789_c0_g1_i2:65-1360(-)